MADEYIEISLHSAPTKLRQLFPNDPRADIQIQYKQKTYNLQKAHLRVQSQYFRRNLTLNRSILQINADFNEDLFDKILFCFYGGAQEIQRSEVLSFYPIVKFLEVQALASILCNDMIKNVCYYNIFELFELSYVYDEQKIFENCLECLKNHGFSEILEERDSLMRTSQEIFKLIVTTHNRSPQRPLNFYEIEKLIIRYGAEHNLAEQEVRDLKFQLIDKNKLTSKEYRDIFIKQQGDKEVRNKYNPGLGVFSLKKVHSFDCPDPVSPAESPKITSSSLNYSQYHRSLALQMQNTFQKKISAELKRQQNQIVGDIKELAKSTHFQLDKSQNFKKEFFKFRKDLNHYHDSERFMVNKFTNIESLLQEVQKDFVAQNEKLEGIYKSLGEIHDRYDKKGKGEDAPPYKTAAQQRLSAVQAETMAHSRVDQIFAKKKAPAPVTTSNYAVSSNYKTPTSPRKRAETMSPTKTSMGSTRNETVRLAQLDYSKMEDTIFFDQRPCTIQTLQQLVSFAEILGADRFTKKSLNLVFRYSNNPSQNYRNYQSMNGRSKLVYLMRTKNTISKLIGGYISSTIDPREEDIADQNAYIFSVTHNRKFRVKEDESAEAIMMNPGYIVCFKTDLMIAEKWDEIESYCSWPDSYDGLSDLQERGSEWLVGGGAQFSLTGLECYQVEEPIMAMMEI